MGKKFDALLGRTFKSSRFKTLVSLTLSRLTVLENQRQHRCSQARSDVTKLLENGEHQRAIVRVEKVIKEQNMLDIFIMIEGFSNLLLERIPLIEQDRVCPDELKEAISSLIYAASRCGDLLELQDVSKMFTSRYGKEFAARAIELRNNCGVSPKIIDGLSTKFPSLEIRMKILKEIASHNNISLQLEDTSTTSEEMLGKRQSHIRPKSDSSISFASTELGDNLMITDGSLSSYRKTKKYCDVADAAQEAFESAAYAAFAAKAALELSRARPYDPGDQDSTGNAQVHEKDGPLKFESKAGIDRIYDEDEDKEFKESTNFKWPTYGSSSHLIDTSLHARGQEKLMQEVIVFDEPDNRMIITPSESKIPETSDYDFDMHHAEMSNDVMHRQIPSTIKGKELKVRNPQSMNIERWPLSVRTRHISGC